MSKTPQPPKLLVADDDPITLQVIRHGFNSIGLNGAFFESGEALLDAIESHTEVCILDVQMPGLNGLECLKAIKKDHPGVEVIILTTINQAAEALNAVRLGAFDYLTKPFDLNDLKTRVRNAMRLSRTRNEEHALRSSFSEPKVDLPDLGKSPAMLGVKTFVERVAPTVNAVLLTGESGTGKTLLARCIHAASDRASKPFVSVSCPSLPGELLESELFGHEKGAFTGANEKRMGRVHMAESGTLFLDEIGDLPLNLQTKLLTFLQEKAYHRVGGDQLISSDLRIIAATNQDLEARVKDGLFRQDLFYRLNVLPVEVPPLSERLQDIPMLVDHFSKKFTYLNKQALPEIAPGVIARLQHFEWPGNIRELENTVVRALALRQKPEVLTEEDLLVVGSLKESSSPTQSLAGMSLRDIEKRAIVETLELCGHCKSEAARMLGIAEKSIYNKMKRHCIEA